MRVTPTIAVLLLVCAVLPGCGTLTPSVTPTPRDGPRWLARHTAQMEQARAANPDIIFLGDSIAAGWLKAGREEWAAHWQPRNAINLGISGDRTEQLLYRIDDGLLDQAQAKAVVIQIGTNNLKSSHVSQPRADTAAGIVAVVDRVRAKQPGAAIFVMGIFPRQPQYEWMNASVREVNRRVARRLRHHEGVRFVELGTRLRGHDGKPNPALYKPDLLHLSAAGYGVWRAALAADVDAAVGRAAE